MVGLQSTAAKLDSWQGREHQHQVLRQLRGRTRYLCSHIYWRIISLFTPDLPGSETAKREDQVPVFTHILEEHFTVHSLFTRSWDSWAGTYFHTCSTGTCHWSVLNHHVLGLLRGRGRMTMTGSRIQKCIPSTSVHKLVLLWLFIEDDLLQNGFLNKIKSI